MTRIEVMYKKGFFPLRKKVISGLLIKSIPLYLNKSLDRYKNDFSLKL